VLGAVFAWTGSGARLVVSYQTLKHRSSMRWSGRSIVLPSGVWLLGLRAAVWFDRRESHFGVLQ
jgi:hypothetical protein